MSYTNFFGFLYFKAALNLLNLTKNQKKYDPRLNSNQYFEKKILSFLDKIKTIEFEYKLFDYPKIFTKFKISQKY